MTAISLAYGKGGLDIELPEDRTVVVEPAYAAAAPDQRLEGMPALLEPVTGPALRDVLRPGTTVAISMCDGNAGAAAPHRGPGRAGSARGHHPAKRMTAAATVVRPGGPIVCAAEYRDGFPDHGSYREALASAASPRALLDAISSRRETIADQWQVQIQAKGQDYARVVMHTSYLSDATLATAHLEQGDDIARTVMASLRAAGPDARVCVLPEGPQTIPDVLGQQA